MIKVEYKPKWDWVPGFKTYAASEDNYFTQVWGCDDARKVNVVIVQQRGTSRLFVSNNDNRGPEDDIGPYPTLNDAICAAEVMIDLGEIPWAKNNLVPAQSQRVQGLCLLHEQWGGCSYALSR